MAVNFTPESGDPWSAFSFLCILMVPLESRRIGVGARLKKRAVKEV